jgi:hypothetical protein
MHDHLRHVMPSTILKDWRITSLWRESAAMGVQAFFGTGVGIGLYWKKEAWEVEYGDTRISK